MLQETHSYLDHLSIVFDTATSSKDRRTDCNNNFGDVPVELVMSSVTFFLNHVTTTSVKCQCRLFRTSL